MKTAGKIILSFFAFVASYYFIYWVPFSLIPGGHDTAYIPTIISLILAAAIAYYIWKGFGEKSNGLIPSILKGGIIVGGVGFVLGFFGPLILRPDSNQGPLLGILITGPVGFVIGLIGGAVLWQVKQRKHSNV